MGGRTWGSEGWGWGPGVGGGGREGKREKGREREEKREKGEEREGGRRRPAGRGWDRWWGPEVGRRRRGRGEERERGRKRGRERREERERRRERKWVAGAGDRRWVAGVGVGRRRRGESPASVAGGEKITGDGEEFGWEGLCEDSTGRDHRTTDPPNNNVQILARVALVTRGRQATVAVRASAGRKRQQRKGRK
ncbi:hypothetical protein TIFTF001_024093 [Ficus carica]|uniref:Uncharacterized protein n=1 Tax=Ficus carica TaxID=3494 RepID=A0AA88DGP2_FICCA|nr:hypothetical protein TIFTF001_024093 [Ficus carica]